MVNVQIKTLITLVGAGSFTKAAEQLSFTQPTVSNHIHSLEREFDIKIFYNDKKELRLTPEGEILLKYARRAISISQNCKQAIEDSYHEINRLTVGVTPSVGENLVPHAIAVYCNEHENTHINIIIDTINNNYSKLKNYEIDVAIVEGNLKNNQLKSILLDTDYLCLAVSPKHKFAKRSSVSVAEMKNEKFILRSSNAGTHQLFSNYLLGHSENIKNFNVIIEIDNVSIIKELVAQDMGITVIAHSACKEDEMTGKLAIVPIENASMVREINMVYHKDFTHTEILENIRQIYNTLTIS